MKAKSVIKIIALSFASIALMIVITLAILASGILGITGCVSHEVNQFNEEREQFHETQEAILDELSEQGYIHSDWKFVGAASDSTWGADKSARSYFYIDADNYKDYSFYWSGEYEKSDLYETGDQVFYMVSMLELKNSDGVDYGNVHLKGRQTYYVVDMYDKALYFVQRTDYDNGSYSKQPRFTYDADSLSHRFVFYKDDKELKMEEVMEMD